MKLLFTSFFSIFCSFYFFACDASSLTIVSGPTAIGGGRYSMVVRLCTAQGLTCQKGNTGNFRFGSTGAGATFVDASCTASVTSGHTGAVNTRGSLSASSTSSYADFIEYTGPDWFALNSGGACVTRCNDITLVLNAFPASIRVFGLESADDYTTGCSVSVTPTPLPIDLVSFTVENKNNVNILKWETASERESDYFLLKRKEDNLHWHTVAKIDGGGNTSSLSNYIAEDDHFEEQINYYKLTQYDFDGAFKDFEIIMIDNSSNKYLVKTVNILGQEVNEDVKGLVIKIYSDGEIVKEYRN